MSSLESCPHLNDMITVGLKENSLEKSCSWWEATQSSGG